MPPAKPKRRAPAPQPAKAAQVIKPPPPPARLFLVRCTFLGQDQAKKRVEGSFRFLLEAPDAAAVQPKLEQAVKRLRRTAELPPQCDVFIEFILELADLKRGLVADFERWEREPRRFQGACITFSDTCPVYQHGHNDPSFRFGKAAAPAAVPAAGP